MFMNMKEKSLESGSFEVNHVNSETPSDWQSLAEKANEFDEERAKELASNEIDMKKLSPELLKMKKDFAPEHLAEISDDEYIKLLQEVPAAFSTHVTRQGVRDHYAHDNHSAGLNQYHNGFLDILENGKKLQSALGACLDSGDAEAGMRKFLELDKSTGRDDVMYFNPYIKEDNLWGRGRNQGFLDKSSVHMAMDTTLEEYYGAEEDNEIFFVFPGAMIASQYDFDAGYGQNQKNMENDQWIYVDGQKGIDVDAGFTFIPKNTMVDRKTGSKYQLDEKNEPILDSETQGLKLATDVVSAQEYWQEYFNKHPDFKPAHIVYYDGAPSEALENWKKKNDIVKPIVEDDLGFSESHLVGSRSDLNQKLMRELRGVRDLAQEVADNYFPKDKIEPISDNIYQGFREEVDEETAAKIADNADLREAIEGTDVHTTYRELVPYLSAESLIKHADLLHAKGIEYDVNDLIPQLGENFIDNNIERLIANGCNVNRLFDRCLEANYEATISKLGDDVSTKDQEKAFDDVVYNYVVSGRAAEFLQYGLNSKEIDKMIEAYSGDRTELKAQQEAWEQAWVGEK